jgi:hypothetical protein
MRKNGENGLYGDGRGMARNCKCAGDIKEGKQIKFRRFSHLGIMGVLRRMLGDVVKSFFFLWVMGLLGRMPKGYHKGHWVHKEKFL